LPRSLKCPSRKAGVIEMAFKFSVGRAVEYKPQGQSAGLFEVTRHMPEEDGSSGRKYRIKSLREGFERTVTEYDLEPADLSEGAYPLAVKPPKASSNKK
jgi:hypothetical protein